MSIMNSSNYLSKNIFIFKAYMSSMIFASSMMLQVLSYFFITIVIKYNYIKNFKIKIN